MLFTQTKQTKVIFVSLGYLHSALAELLEKGLLNYGRDSEAMYLQHLWSKKSSKLQLAVSKIAIVAKQDLRIGGIDAQEHMVPGWDQASGSSTQHPMEASNCKDLADGSPKHVQSIDDIRGILLVILYKIQTFNKTLYHKEQEQDNGKQLLCIREDVYCKRYSAQMQRDVCHSDTYTSPPNILVLLLETFAGVGWGTP